MPPPFPVWSLLQLTDFFTKTHIVACFRFLLGSQCYLRYNHEFEGVVKVVSFNIIVFYHLQLGSVVF